MNTEVQKPTYMTYHQKSRAMLKSLLFDGVFCAALILGYGFGIIGFAHIASFIIIISFGLRIFYILAFMISANAVVFKYRPDKNLKFVCMVGEFACVGVLAWFGFFVTAVFMLLSWVIVRTLSTKLFNERFNGKT